MRARATSFITQREAAAGQIRELLLDESGAAGGVRFMRELDTSLHETRGWRASGQTFRRCRTSCFCRAQSGA